MIPTSKKGLLPRSENKRAAPLHPLMPLASARPAAAPLLLRHTITSQTRAKITKAKITMPILFPRFRPWVYVQRYF
jgi:hypothetical protein